MLQLICPCYQQQKEKMFIKTLIPGCPACQSAPSQPGKERKIFFLNFIFNNILILILMIKMRPKSRNVCYQIFAMDVR
jgi:hypothetical protein